MEAKTYTTMEICKQLDAPRHIVNSLCNRGLIPHLKRNHFGRRIFSQEQVELIAILVKMRQAGFTSAELRQYSRLARQGSSTAADRLAILTTRKHQLWQEIKERQQAIDFIERQEEIATDSHAYADASGHKTRPERPGAYPKGTPQATESSTNAPKV